MSLKKLALSLAAACRFTAEAKRGYSGAPQALSFWSILHANCFQKACQAHLSSASLAYSTSHLPTLDARNAVRMDVVQAVSGYVSKMVSYGDGTAGTTSAKMKILLLDSETVRLSLCDYENAD